jgi:hypothetical protein
MWLPQPFSQVIRCPIIREEILHSFNQFLEGAAPAFWIAGSILILGDEPLVPLAGQSSGLFLSKPLASPSLLRTNTFNSGLDLGQPLGEFRLSLGQRHSGGQEQLCLPARAEDPLIGRADVLGDAFTGAVTASLSAGQASV